MGRLGAEKEKKTDVLHPVNIGWHACDRIASVHSVLGRDNFVCTFICSDAA